MANTWTILCKEVVLGNDKNMAAILNAGARVLRIRRIGFSNQIAQTSAGVMTELHVRRLRATASFSVAPTAVTPMEHDTTNSALVSVTAGYSGTVATTGTTDTLRRIFWSTTKATVSGGSIDNWECLIPLNIVWDAGYGESRAQALPVKQDQMVHIYNETNTTTGYLDTWMEFNDEAA